MCGTTLLGTSSANCEFLSDLIGSDATLTVDLNNAGTLLTIAVTDVTALCDGFLFGTVGGDDARINLDHVIDIQIL